VNFENLNLLNVSIERLKEECAALGAYLQQELGGHKIAGNVVLRGLSTVVGCALQCAHLLWCVYVHRSFFQKINVDAAQTPAPVVRP